jgi:hypothetical protein
MVRIRHGWLVVVLALAFVAACKKDNTAAEKAGGKSGSAAYGDDLSLLPRDSEIVVGLNISQVQQSALWKQFVEPKLSSGEALRKIGEFKAKCGVDPMAVVKSLSIGVKGIEGGKPDGVVVVHGMDKAKAMSCLDSMKEDMAKDGVELSHDGDVVLLKNSKSSAQFAMTYVNDSTALAVFGEQASAASLKALQSSSQTLKSSQPFLDMYGKIKTSDSMWLLVSGKFLEKGAAFGVNPMAVFGSANVTEGLTMDLRTRFRTPDEATKFANLAKSQAQQATKMFDKFDITNDGSEVRFSIVLSSQKLQDLIKQFSGMFGMMGGAMEAQ